MNAAKKKTAKKPTRAVKPPVKKIIVKPVAVPVVVNMTRPARPAKRAEPQWLLNFKEFAAKNPAATVVGILAVTLALILLLGR